MRRVTIRQASQPLGQYAAELKNEIVVVTKGKRAVAALVPLKNVDRESLALSGHPEFLELIGRARAEIATGRKRSLAEIKARVPGRRSRSRRMQLVSVPSTLYLPCGFWRK